MTVTASPYFCGIYDFRTFALAGSHWEIFSEPLVAVRCYKNNDQRLFDDFKVFDDPIVISNTVFNDPKVISDVSMGFGNSKVRGDTSIFDGLFRMLKSQALNEGELAAEGGFVFHLADSVMRAPTRDFFGLLGAAAPSDPRAADPVLTGTCSHCSPPPRPDPDFSAPESLSDHGLVNAEIRRISIGQNLFDKVFTVLGVPITALQVPESNFETYFIDIQTP